MKLYVVRHGQSASNKSGVRNGQTDVPLTSEGYKDAEKTGQKLKNIKLDEIYSSDLIRAIETAKTAIPGCIPIEDARLREIDVGKLAGHTPDECRILFDNYDENNKCHNYVPYSGENADMIFSRVSSFMQMLESRQNYENIGVFCHQGAIFYMLRYVLGYSIENGKIACDNGSITVFEYKNKSWKLLKSNM